MRRLAVAVVISAVTAFPVRADDARPETAPATGSGVRIVAPHLDLSTAALAKAVAATSPVQQAPAINVGRTSTRAKTIYIATLAAAVGGMIYNIKTTREALDKGLEARTFPLVWKKTNDPKDKNRVTGIIAGANGGLLAVGALVFRRGDAPLATFVNAIVAGATLAVGLHNKSVIDDCTTPACQ